MALKLRVVEIPTDSGSVSMASVCCVESDTSADTRPAARIPAKIKFFVNIVDGKAGRRCCYRAKWGMNSVLL